MVRPLSFENRKEGTIRDPTKGKHLCFEGFRFGAGGAEMQSERRADQIAAQISSGKLSFAAIGEELNTAEADEGYPANDAKQNRSATDFGRRQ
jgi:hypothetical protein